VRRPGLGAGRPGLGGFRRDRRWRARGLSRVGARALDEPYTGQAAEAEHPDAEPDGPEDCEDADDDCGVPEPPGPPAVARDEDRIIRWRSLDLGFECSHGSRRRDAHESTA
jgi:hypothetical protein